MSLEAFVAFVTFIHSGMLAVSCRSLQPHKTSESFGAWVSSKQTSQGQDYSRMNMRTDTLLERRTLLSPSRYGFLKTGEGSVQGEVKCPRSYNGPSPAGHLDEDDLSNLSKLGSLLPLQVFVMGSRSGVELEEAANAASRRERPAGVRTLLARSLPPTPSEGPDLRAIRTVLEHTALHVRHASSSQNHPPPVASNHLCDCSCSSVLFCMGRASTHYPRPRSSRRKNSFTWPYLARAEKLPIHPSVVHHPHQQQFAVRSLLPLTPQTAQLQTTSPHPHARSQPLSPLSSHSRPTERITHPHSPNQPKGKGRPNTPAGAQKRAINMRRATKTLSQSKCKRTCVGLIG